MCDKNKEISLQTAVLMQINEFVNSGQSFSRYDVVNALRQKCNDGFLYIDGFNKIIKKKIFNKVFDELWTCVLKIGLPALNCRLAQSPNGLKYRLYSTNCNTEIPKSDNYIISKSGTLGSDIDAIYKTNKIFTDDESGTLGYKRIKTYLINCVSKNVKPTLKQIQSAIKRRNGGPCWTCKDIHNIINSSYELKYLYT